MKAILCPQITKTIIPMQKENINLMGDFVKGWFTFGQAYSISVFFGNSNSPSKADICEKKKKLI